MTRVHFFLPEVHVHSLRLLKYILLVGQCHSTRRELAPKMRPCIHSDISFFIVPIYIECLNLYQDISIIINSFARVHVCVK